MMTATPNDAWLRHILWQTSHHCDRREQHHFERSEKHHIAAGDASFEDMQGYALIYWRKCGIMKKKGGELPMEFSHCDNDEKHLSLHDCIAERAYFENGKLGFEFNDGFWISPDHPGSNLSNLVRTDFSKVEYTLEDGADYDVTIYVFKKNIFIKTIRIEWTIQELLNNINSGKYKLEFLYQYVDYSSRIIECELKLDKKPYRMECVIKISAPEVSYYWNNLCEDRPW